MRWASLNMTGEFMDEYPEYSLTGNWWYDYPTDRWRQDRCSHNATTNETGCTI